MNKKVLLVASTLICGVSMGLAMSSSDSAKTPKKIEKTQLNESQKKLVDIYSKDDKGSGVTGEITFKDQNDYNIFYCKQNGWCEVVERNDGKVGWINLEELKQAQQSYAQKIDKKHTLERLVDYTRLQDQKIIQLQSAMMNMQKEFAYALQTQQAQINQLKQAYYVSNMPG